VAKMNVLLGLPVGRVQRIQPLSIFFLMHLLICLAGGLSAAMFTYHLLHDAGGALAWSLLVGAAMAVLLILLYIGMVLATTAESKLKDSGE
jgi:uncharacterized ion transporter superfamily protein YfcC